MLLLVAGRSAAEASSTSARLLMLKRAIPLVLNSPLVGNGVNQAATLIGFVGARGVLTVDSLLISFAVESGVIALLAYVFSVLAGFIHAVRNSLGESREDSILQLGFATSLILFLMTSVTLSLTGNMYFLAFCLPWLSARRVIRWKKVSVVVILLNWRNASDTIAAVESLLQTNSEHQFKILVCDNASGDGSEDFFLNWANNHPSVSSDF